MQPPAEDKGGEEANKRCVIGDQPRIGRHDAEPHQPLAAEIKDRGDRRSQDGRDEIPTHQQACDTIQHSPQKAADMQDIGHQLDDQGYSIEQQQDIEEPQMGQGEGGHRQTRRRRGRRAMTGRRRIGGDGNGDDGSHDQRPEDGQRQGDALKPIADKAGDALLLQHQAREETGQHKEGRHAEHVDDIEQQGQAGVVRRVLDQPDLRFKKRHGRVQGDPQQQGKGPHRVKIVPARRWHSGSDRHEILPLTAPSPNVEGR